jgi:hypothetical protein
VAHSHKRETNARALPQHVGRSLGRAIARTTSSRATRVAGVAAVLATLPAVGVGVLHAAPAARHLVSADAPATGALANALTEAQIARRGPLVSRTSDRAFARGSGGSSAGDLTISATAKAVADASVRRWTTTALDLWSTASSDATQVGEIVSGRQVLVTGRAADGRVEIVVNGLSRWVTTGYLSPDKPVAAAAGLSMAPCPDGSVEYRLTPAAVYVYRSVCHAFPQITTYGGWDNHGEHVSGKALDIMTSDVPLGNAIAAFLQAHAAELHIYDILWQQHIWTPVRASEGWRLFANRGSPTANHDDHVHVSVN